MGNITINPSIMTNAAGSFTGPDTTGLIVGTMMPDPGVRYQLAHGYLDPAATLPIWGGVAISENIPQPSSGPIIQLGPKIARATADANNLGIAIDDQNYAEISSPQSPRAMTPQGGQVNFLRWGSLMRVALEIDPTLVTLEGGLTTAAVGWDYTNQKIIAGAGFKGKILTIFIGNSYTTHYDAPSGFATWNKTASAAIVLM
jgi:hypothetical protein